MRTKLLLLGLVTTMTALPALAEPEPVAQEDPDPKVVERAVAFEVVNVNRSATSQLCSGDGATYTVRGALVGPAGVQAGKIEAVTLYLAGSGDASAWHFTAVPGVDHITEMAKLGHASVSVHLPGYGISDPADGNELCIGTFADHAHQVISQLRAGSYSMARGRSPAFERVALAGHSGGGAVAQLSTNSFHDADALIVASWTSLAMAAAPMLGRQALRCLLEPEAKQPGGPGGWARFLDRSEQEFNDHNIEPEVLNAFIDAYEQDPCGWHDDFVAVSQVNFVRAPTVDVPVLLATGDRDLFATPAAVELKRARYERGNDDVSTLIVPDTQHLIMLERSARELRAGLSAWLAARGF